MKTEFKQPTKDIYKLAKITEDFCKESINDARKKSIKFRNWFDKNAEINIEIVEDEKNKIE